MNRNHRNYPRHDDGKKYTENRLAKNGGVWQYTENRPQNAARKRPGISPGNIDFPKLLSALGINDPRLNMIMSIMKNGNSPASLMALMQQMGKRPY